MWEHDEGHIIEETTGDYFRATSVSAPWGGWGRPQLNQK